MANPETGLSERGIETPQSRVLVHSYRHLPAPALRTPRSPPTSKRLPQPDSGIEPAKAAAPWSKRPDPASPKPTARSNASTASSLRNGPTSVNGPQRPNAKTPTPGSSTPTITTDLTDRSNGQPPPASSRTTSPKSSGLPITEPRHEPGVHGGAALGTSSRMHLGLVVDVDIRVGHAHRSAPQSEPFGTRVWISCHAAR
jgi:hypothetical protein